MTLFFGICFVVYFLKLSAGRGYWRSRISLLCVYAITEGWEYIVCHLYQCSKSVLDKRFIQSTFSTRENYTKAREIWKRTKTKTGSSFVNTTRVTPIIIFLTVLQSEVFCWLIVNLDLSNKMCPCVWFAFFFVCCMGSTTFQSSGNWGTRRKA